MGVCAVHELWMFIGCGEDGVRAERALLIKLKVTDVQGTTSSSILSCLSKVDAL